MGSMPFGLFFGVGNFGEWGLFTGTLNSCSIQLVCENCTRVRSTKATSSTTIFGSYVLGNTLYVVTADVVGTGCLSVNFVGSDGEVSVALKVSKEVLQPLAAPSPGGTLFPTPQGPAATVLLEAELPTVPVSGDYVMSVVDQCCGFETALGTVSLEVDVIVLNPTDADLGGAPLFWVERDYRSGTIASQTNTGAVRGIPFDRCEAVVEYDARFGTLPAAQGFSFIGTGVDTDWALLSGGSLRGLTPGSGATGYWRKDVVLPAIEGRVNAYARYAVQDNVGGDATANGLNFVGMVAPGGAAAWEGVRWRLRDAASPLKAVFLDGSSDAALFIPGVFGSAWRQDTFQSHFADDRAIVFSDNIPTETGAAGIFSTLAGGPASPTIRAEFGDILGSGITALVRNFVVSTPGRFIRAWYRAYATVTNPMVRLYVSSDLDSSGETLARFLVRYGSADPFAVPGSTVSGTVSFPTRNTVFELPLQLAGLTANQPFWFTVERELGHVDDRTEATVWLHQATVRGA
jgi:hypothetical protein